MPWWTLPCTASHDPGQRIDWGWQTDMRSHNSGYKNRGFCWLIVMTEYHQLTPQQLCHYAAFIFRTLQCCSLQEEDTGILSSDAGDHLRWCPRGLATSDRVLCVGARIARVWCIRVLLRTGPAQRVAARARALHQSWADQLSVTHREASSGHAEYSQVSALYTLRRQAIPRGILSHFLHFCILLICQYLLSADKHRPRSTKEVLVRTAPIELY